MLFSPVLATKLRVVSDITNYFNIAEVYVYSARNGRGNWEYQKGENITPYSFYNADNIISGLYGASLSSTWDPPTLFPPSNAIDGDVYSFAHSGLEVSDMILKGKPITNNIHQANPYLEINIPSNNMVVKVEVYNRIDCCQDRLSPFCIYQFARSFFSTSIFVMITCICLPQKWSIFIYNN